VVKALASQIVAYSLRNLEQRAIEEELPGPVDGPPHDHRLQFLSQMFSSISSATLMGQMMQRMVSLHRMKTTLLAALES